MRSKCKGRNRLKALLPYRYSFNKGISIPHHPFVAANWYRRMKHQHYKRTLKERGCVAEIKLSRSKTLKLQSETDCLSKKKLMGSKTLKLQTGIERLCCLELMSRSETLKLHTHRIAVLLEANVKERDTKTTEIERICC